jgi:hypothetical protein
MARPDQIIFGTMRMHESSRSAAEWAEFLSAIFDRGIRKLHSSDEYDSFGLLCETLAILARQAPERKFCHMVKLADPSFDDTGFDASRFSTRLDQYRQNLIADHIEDIQWMWRADLKNDTKRIGDARAAMRTIDNGLARLKADGLISRLFCFPYSEAFAEAILQEHCIDGMTIYRNSQEMDYGRFLDQMVQANKICVAIRPFHAGAALAINSPSPAEQIKFVLSHPAVEAAILSTSSLDHLEMILD